jgi:uncharacterized membrane protein YfcA
MTSTLPAFAGGVPTVPLAASARSGSPIKSAVGTSTARMPVTTSAGRGVTARGIADDSSDEASLAKRR